MCLIVVVGVCLNSLYMSGTCIAFRKLTAFCHIKSLTEQITSYLKDKFHHQRLVICIHTEILLS